jgi:hypothetical protein
MSHLLASAGLHRCVIPSDVTSILAAMSGAGPMSHAAGNQVQVSGPVGTGKFSGKLPSRQGECNGAASYMACFWGGGGGGSLMLAA